MHSSLEIKDKHFRGSVILFLQQKISNRFSPMALPSHGFLVRLQYQACIPSCVAGLCLIKKLLVTPRTFVTLLHRYTFLAKQVIIEVCRAHSWVVHTIETPTSLRACKVPSGVMKANKESFNSVPNHFSTYCDQSVCCMCASSIWSYHQVLVNQELWQWPILIRSLLDPLIKHQRRHSLPSTQFFIG